MNEVEGTPTSQKVHFPFSKPSPFSSMTDGVGRQQTMTPPFFSTTNPKMKLMTAETGLQTKILREMLNFQKSMEELRLLKMVSRDIRKFKKMPRLKKYD